MRTKSMRMRAAIFPRCHRGAFLAPALAVIIHPIGYADTREIARRRF